MKSKSARMRRYLYILIGCLSVARGVYTQEGDVKDIFRLEDAPAVNKHMVEEGPIPFPEKTTGAGALARDRKSPAGSLYSGYEGAQTGGCPCMYSGYSPTRDSPYGGYAGQQPGASSPGSPGSSSGSPGSSTPGSPGSSTPGSPDYSTPGSPGSSTPGSPDYSTPGSPGSSTPGSPGSSTPGSPDYSTPGSPGSSTPGSPGSSTPGSPGTSQDPASMPSTAISPSAMPPAPGNSPYQLNGDNNLFDLMKKANDIKLKQQQALQAINEKLDMEQRASDDDKNDEVKLVSALTKSDSDADATKKDVQEAKVRLQSVREDEAKLLKDIAELKKQVHPLLALLRNLQLTKARLQDKILQRKNLELNIKNMGKNLSKTTSQHAKLVVELTRTKKDLLKHKRRRQIDLTEIKKINEQSQKKLAQITQAEMDIIKKQGISICNPNPRTPKPFTFIQPPPSKSSKTPPPQPLDEEEDQDQEVPEEPVKRIPRKKLPKCHAKRQCSCPDGSYGSYPAEENM